MSSFVSRVFSERRMLDWLLVAALLAMVVWLVAPHQLPVSLYKLSLLSLAAVAGYWIDRSLFPYARPDSFLCFTAGDEDDEGKAATAESQGPEGATLAVQLVSDQPLLRLMAAAMLRRAIVVAAAMISVGLGA